PRRTQHIDVYLACYTFKERRAFLDRYLAREAHFQESLGRKCTAPLPHGNNDAVDLLVSNNVFKIGRFPEDDRPAELLHRLGPVLGNKSGDAIAGIAAFPNRFGGIERSLARADDQYLFPYLRM